MDMFKEWLTQKEKSKSLEFLEKENILVDMQYQLIEIYQKAYLDLAYEIQREARLTKSDIQSERLNKIINISAKLLNDSLRNKCDRII